MGNHPALFCLLAGFTASQGIHSSHHKVAAGYSEDDGGKRLSDGNSPQEYAGGPPGSSRTAPSSTAAMPGGSCPAPTDRRACPLGRTSLLFLVQRLLCLQSIGRGI